jgi:hypothetical protein
VGHFEITVPGSPHQVMYTYIMSHRTQITLTDAQYERLLNESAHSGLALAELIRRAIERSYGATSRHELRKALDESFGTWTERDDVGAAYVDDLRRGMARRLADR